MSSYFEPKSKMHRIIDEYNDKEVSETKVKKGLALTRQQTLPKDSKFDDARENLGNEAIDHAKTLKKLRDNLHGDK